LKLKPGELSAIDWAAILVTGACMEGLTQHLPPPLSPCLPGITLSPYTTTSYNRLVVTSIKFKQ